MREIKFRAWHKADKKMYVVIGFSLGKWFLRGKSYPMPRSAIELVQYTGLKDKNGIEIYEGDILKWDEKEWGDPFNELVQWDFDQLDMRENDWAEFCEVVGNIYENPDLMEVKQ